MSAPNVLGAQSVPRFFAVADAEATGLAAPAPRHEVAIRAHARSLAGMQKEALVARSGAGPAWRLVSDEGPYLAGHDEAPFPLAFLTAGLVASYAHALLTLAGDHGVATDGLALTLDNRYTMEGSALRGTMTGGAHPPRLRVSLPAADDAPTAEALAAAAVEASPWTALVRGEHVSRFTLTVDDAPADVDGVTALAGPPEPDRTDRLDDLRPATSHPEPLVVRTVDAESVEGVEGGKGSSLRPDQKRTLHVRGTCTVRGDGVKDIEVRLHQPLGSTFRFLSDEPPDAGGRGRAPDAATLVAAGIAFCFMTQFGRYATIARKRLDRYRIVQDLHAAAGGTGPGGTVDPVDTHVHLDTPEGVDFAHAVVRMGEQTCFLHALCRTPLDVELDTTTDPPASR